MIQRYCFKATDSCACVFWSKLLFCSSENVCVCMLKPVLEPVFSFRHLSSLIDCIKCIKTLPLLNSPASMHAWMRVCVCCVIVCVFSMVQRRWRLHNKWFGFVRSDSALIHIEGREKEKCDRSIFELVECSCPAYGAMDCKDRVKKQNIRLNEEHMRKQDKSKRQETGQKRESVIFLIFNPEASCGLSNMTAGHVGITQHWQVLTQTGTGHTNTTRAVQVCASGEILMDGSFKEDKYV